jgi:hypothetical protein
MARELGRWRASSPDGNLAPPILCPRLVRWRASSPGGRLARPTASQLARRQASSPLVISRIRRRASSPAAAGARATLSCFAVRGARLPEGSGASSSSGELARPTASCLARGLARLQASSPRRRGFRGFARLARRTRAEAVVCRRWCRRADLQLSLSSSSPRRPKKSTHRIRRASSRADKAAWTRLFSLSGGCRGRGAALSSCVQIRGLAPCRPGLPRAVGARPAQSELAPRFRSLPRAVGARPTQSELAPRFRSLPRDFAARPAQSELAPRFCSRWSGVA